MKLQKCTIDILTMAAADTEYFYDFPKNVERFRVKLRDDTVALRIGAATGKVAMPTDPYLSIPAGILWEEDGLSLPESTKFYFATPTTSQVLEIMYWTGVERVS